MSLKVAGINKTSLRTGTPLPATSNLTFGSVIDLWKFNKSENNAPKIFCSWIQQLAVQNLSSNECKALESKVRRIEKTLSKLRGLKLASAREEIFYCPCHMSSIPKPKTALTKTNNKDKDSSSPTLSPRKKLRGISRVQGHLKHGSLLKQATIRHVRAAKLLLERRNKVSSLLQLNKQVKRKHETLKRKHTQALVEIEELKHEAKKRKLAVSEEQKDLKKQHTYPLKKKLASIQHDFKTLIAVGMKDQRKMENMNTEIETLRRDKGTLQRNVELVGNEVESLKGTNNELIHSVEFLSTLVEDGKNVDLYDESAKKFTNETVECVMNLTSLGVAARNAGAVIKEVLRVVNKEANRLPARTTVDEMNDSKLAVAQKQLKTIASSETSQLCLMTDETSKRGIKSNVYIVSDVHQNSYMLGLRQMATKSAATVLDTFKEILSDISEACSSMEKNTDIANDVGYQILAEIRSTMSDRAASEKLFNKLLEEYREGYLPVILGDWHNMSDEAKEHTSKLHNFYCALHLLVAFADVSSANISKFECLHTEEKQPNCSTVNLIRMCAKAFARGGDEKSGCFIHWKTFLDTEKCKTTFFRFNHNRFNVVFVLAKIVYFHHKRITHFLGKVFGANNLLLQAIQRDIQVPVFIEGCRILGLISDLITAPFWRIVESCKHVLGLNIHYRSMQQFLKQASEDPVDFLSGKSPFSEDCLDRDNEVSKFLLDGACESHLSTQIAQGVCLGLLQLMERMLPDQLEGGKYYEPTQALLQATTATPTHNKLPEFAFGILDRLVSFRPNATTLANEAYIMYGFNKTGAWLRSLPKKEKEQYLQQARTEGRMLRKKFKQRLKEIEAEQQRQLEKREKDLARIEASRVKKLENLTTDVVNYGLWQSEQDMDLALQEIGKEAEQKKSIQAQLKFRKEVLKQKFEDIKVFNVSRQVDGKSKKLTLLEMKSNLMKLIVAAAEGNTSEVMSRRPSQPLLVGKYVEHTFADGKKYKGHVISVVPGFPAWYNILYDGDEAIYSYKLQQDYRDGDLRIVPCTAAAATTSPDSVDWYGNVEAQELRKPWCCACLVRLMLAAEFTVICLHAYILLLYIIQQC